MPPVKFETLHIGAFTIVRHYIHSVNRDYLYQ